MIKEQNKLISVVGPTASGKSALGVHIAKKFFGDIISIDSRQIYKYMNIATGKEPGKIDSKKCMFIKLDQKKKKICPYVSQKVNNWMINIADPKEDFFSVAQFQDMSYQIIFKLFSKKVLPVLVGGTGLYMDAICEGYLFPKTSIRLRKELERFKTKELLSELKKNDPKTYEKIDHKNRRRILRALESYLVNKESHSEKRKKKPNFDYLTIAIDWPREELYKRIDIRVDQWMKEGLIDEVSKLHIHGVSYKKLQNFGLEYRNVALYLQGKISRTEMINNMKFETHAFARRQLTWWRRNKNIIWLKPDKLINQKAEKLVRDFLE